MKVFCEKGRLFRHRAEPVRDANLGSCEAKWQAAVREKMKSDRRGSQKFRDEMTIQNTVVSRQATAKKTAGQTQAITVDTGHRNL